MKHNVIKLLMLAGAITIISGCGNNTSLEGDDTYITESGISNTDSTNKVSTDAVNDVVTEDIVLTGDYDDIFCHELTSQNNGTPHVVISGYDFTVDSSAYATYFDDVGIAFVSGDELQYKIKVQDKTFDEIKKIDVTEKAVAAGFEITTDATTVKDGELEYIYFSYIADGERGVAINMPGPDKDHALGVQVAIMKDSVSDGDAIKTALLVAKTASITDAPDTTADEIKKLYGSSAVVSTTKMKEFTIKFNGTKFTHPVPDGFGQTYSDDSDPEIYIAGYNSSDIDVSILYSKSKNFTDADHYIESMLMWNSGEVKETASACDISYARIYNKEFNFYEILAAKYLENGYIFEIDAESESKNLKFEDIQGFFIASSEDTVSDEPTGLGPHTAIKHDQIYKGSVKDEATALSLISQYGQMQHERYDNSLIKDIEESLQNKYGIISVNLGEIDIETAKDIERGVSYMFDTYPFMKGSLHTISLANLKGRESSYLAVTRTADFILENDEGIPKVVRNEIILNASKWLDREQLLKTCKENVESGYWFDNANDPSKIIVHELGHQLLNVMRAKKYNFVVPTNPDVYMPALITESIRDSYLDYYWSGTALNQEVEKDIMSRAYSEWKSMGNKGSEEDFRSSISKYANGIKDDGGVSYHETFAEAVADIYCNGENCSDASKAILNQTK